MDKKLKFAYDKKGDVLDIFVNKPKKAISEELEDDVILRKNLKTGKIVGITVLNFLKRFEDKKEIAMELPI